MAEYDRWPLDRWSKGFSGIYKNNDDQRTLANFWMQVSNDASKVAEEVRKKDYQNTVYRLGNAFCWMCCFTERLKQDMKESEPGRDLLKQRGELFQDWILERYPLVCHHCAKKPCICILNTELMENRNELAFKEKWESEKLEIIKRFGEVKKSISDIKQHCCELPLDKFFEEFFQIYGNKTELSSLEDLTFHYLEEVGEVAHAITHLETLVGQHDAKEWKEHVQSDPTFEKFRNEEWKASIPTLLGRDMDSKTKEEIKKLEDPATAATAYKTACVMVMDEISDVFSWTTSILNKIIKLRKNDRDVKISIVRVFACDSGVVGEAHSTKSYIDKGALIASFRCPYCTNRECTIACPLSGAIKNVAESIIKGN